MVIIRRLRFSARSGLAELEEMEEGLIKIWQTFALGLLCLTPPATESASDETVIVGAGSFTCQRYLDAGTGDTALVLSWVQGYLSGTNMYRYVAYRKDMVLMPDLEVISGKLSSYCRSNPTQTIYRGSIAVCHEREVRKWRK